MLIQDKDVISCTKVFDELDRKELSVLVYVVEAMSEHYIAKSILEGDYHFHFFENPIITEDPQNECNESATTEGLLDIVVMVSDCINDNPGLETMRNLKEEVANYVLIKNILKEVMTTFDISSKAFDTVRLQVIPNKRRC